MITAARFVNSSNEVCVFNDEYLPFSSFTTSVYWRFTERSKVMQHGIWPGPSYLGKRLFTVEGDLLALDSDGYWDKRLEFISAIVPQAGESSVGTLYLTLDGISQELSAECTLDGWPELPLQALYPSSSKYQINWKAFDPRLYGTLQTAETILGVYEGSDSNFGMWEATTNLIQNGGCEVDALGVSNYGNAAITRTNGYQAKYGKFVWRVTNTGTGSFTVFAANRGSTFIPVTAGQPYAWSFYAANSGTPNPYIRPQILWYNSGGSLISSTLGTPVLTSGRITDPGARRYVIGTAPTGAVGAIGIVAATSAGPSSAFVLDGLQFENKKFMTPYVETTTAIASSTATRIQVSASSLDETQGWVAFRIKYGFNSTAGPTLAPYLFGWFDDWNNRLDLFLEPTNHNWILSRQVGASGSAAFSPGQTFTIGDMATVVAAWTATGVKVSVNGGVFVSVANTSIPTLAATFADIGCRSTIYQLNGNIMWGICGTGTLTNEDATTLYALGDTLPSLDTLPVGAIFSSHLVGASVTNGGNIETYPTIVFYGPSTSPALTNGSQTITLAGLTLSAGEYVVVDVGARTALQGGSTNVYHHTVGSTWWALEPGENAVSYSATSLTGSATLSWQDAFMI